MSTFRELARQRGALPRLLGLAVVMLAVGVVTGRLSARRGPAPPAAGSGASAPTGKTTVWTCSMHPQIRQPEPGKCPICGMTLIPAKGGEDNLGPRMMSMSEDAMKLAEVETSTLQKRYLDLTLLMVGLIDYDETRVRTIAAWMPGRLDRLFVDYTGVAVKRGDHMVKIYSPELFAAQEELLQAKAAVASLSGSNSESVKRSTSRMLVAAREKLRLLGLTAAQVRGIERRGRASAILQIDAPASGIVIHKNAEEGMYVKTGTPIYKLADLSAVWLRLDAYESDIAWLRYGQEVEVRTESYGDRTFKGWVSFIAPVLDPKTRSIKVRVNVDNREGLLKPNMFVRARVRVRIGDQGRVVGNDRLAGKWICPMHPEITASKPGKCSICGMALVQAKDLGLADTSEVPPGLVVPASAVLVTGKRAVVYLRVPGRKHPTFQGVEVKVGPRAGDHYVVLSGLREGQEVVTNGNFKIDSALQLLAKPSMMSPGKDKRESAPAPAKAEPVRAPAAFLRKLDGLYTAYLDAQEALVADREQPARAALDRLFDGIGKVDMQLAGSAHMAWMKIARELKKSLRHRRHAQGLAGLRKVFIGVSRAVVRMDQILGHAGKAPHRVAFCPMAAGGKGAQWLQRGAKVRNPFYGSAMPGCGEIRATLAGTGASKEGE